MVKIFIRENKKLCREAKNYLEVIRKNKYGKYCLTVEVESYTELGCLLFALIHISQQSLFLKEEKAEEDIRIDIYNLLDFANKLIPFPELELLNEIKDEKVIK